MMTTIYISIIETKDFYKTSKYLMSINTIYLSNVPKENQFEISILYSTSKEVKKYLYLEDKRYFLQKTSYTSRLVNFIYLNICFIHKK